MIDENSDLFGKLLMYQYQAKLIALLEGLECENIPDLLTKDPEYFRAIGKEIAKYAKAGAFSDLVSEMAKTSRSSTPEEAEACRRFIERKFKQVGRPE
jgi:hypothetical protein